MLEQPIVNFYMVLGLLLGTFEL